MTPKRIPADPRVAMAAWEVPSETRLDMVHHVALLRGDAPDECQASLDGHRELSMAAKTRWPSVWLVICGDCKAALRWFDCTCESCSLGGEVCKHIRACREAWPEEQRANGRTS